MAEELGSMLSTEQKAQLQEIADLMLAIYQTLAEMQYVQPEGIIRGPHDISEILDTYKKHNLDPAIIYLYSILPYVDTDLAHAADFFQGGAFFNHLSEGDVEQSRDPCYASPSQGFDVEDGEYMYPWYTPLSNCGNHSPIMIFDAKECRMWIVDQIQRSTTDPVFCKGWYGDVEEVKEESNWGESDGSDWEEDGGDEEDSIGSGGSSEFWDDDDESFHETELDGLKTDQEENVEYDEGFEVVEEPSEWERQQALNLKNENSLELARSRNAADVLRDVERYYRELKELPGQGEYSHGEWMQPNDLKPLYLKNGWPDQFNGEAFNVDVARAYCRKRAEYFAEEPLRKVECHEGWAEYSRRDVDRYEGEIANATSPGEEWKTRFELWKAQERSDRNAEDLRKAREKAEKMCPGGTCQRDEDLPLWELERLRVELQHKRETLNRRANWKDDYKGDEEAIRRFEIRHEHNVRKAAYYAKAFDAAKADAERLCPGQTFESATGIKSLGRQDTLSQIESEKYSIEYSRNYLQQLHDFAAKVPAEAAEAKKTVESEIERWQTDIVRMQERLEKTEQWLAEHGNTD